jgi:hypothetical protein
MHSTTQDQPLDKRCRGAHPERIVVGDEIFIRNDISAARLGESERSHNRRDKQGAPYQYFGNIKYRPERRLNAFILNGVIEHKPQPPKRPRKTRC